jgi:hypothetical protein
MANDWVANLANSIGVHSSMAACPAFVDSWSLEYAGSGRHQLKDSLTP